MSMFLFSRMNQYVEFAHRLWAVQFEKNDDYGHDKFSTRVEVFDEELANVVSSEQVAGGHTIMIDIDHLAHLVPSTTPGHSHLYVEIPAVPWDKYDAWLKASVDIGLIEPGYYKASSARKATYLRLPWVKK